MTLRKLICVAIIFALALSTLCSCGGTEVSADELIATAEEALKSESYSVNMRVLYSSENEELKTAIGAFNDPTAKVLVDKENFSIETTTAKSGVAEKQTYTLVDGKLYSAYEYSGYKTVNELPYDEATVAELKTALGEGANISVNDFKTATVETEKNATVITCTEVKDEALNSLIASIQQQLDKHFIVVTIKDVTLTVQLVDGKYDSTSLECIYHLTTESDVYVLNMTLNAKFNYGEVEISVPTVS